MEQLFTDREKRDLKHICNKTTQLLKSIEQSKFKGRESDKRFAIYCGIITSLMDSLSDQDKKILVKTMEDIYGLPQNGQVNYIC